MNLQNDCKTTILPMKLFSTCKIQKQFILIHHHTLALHQLCSKLYCYYHHRNWFRFHLLQTDSVILSKEKVHNSKPSMVVKMAWSAEISVVKTTNDLHLSYIFFIFPFFEHRHILLLAFSLPLFIQYYFYQRGSPRLAIFYVYWMNNYIMTLSVLKELYRVIDIISSFVYLGLDFL